MNRVALLLHLYQPPTQDAETLALVDRECYAPLARALASTGAGVTLNINLSLTRRLSESAPGTLETLAGARGFELCTSGAYHPILPLVPPSEAEREIGLNTEGNASFLPGREIRGVFPPEMAWDPSLAPLFSRLGLGWTITDDIPWVHSGRQAPFDWIPSVGGLRIFLRSNFWSNRIAFHETDGGSTALRLLDGLSRWSGGRDAYIVIALDGETFGHHRKGAVERFLLPFLETVTEAGGARLSTLSEVAGAFPAREGYVPSGSWSTTPADLDRGVPWPLWSDPDVPDHSALYALRDLVLPWARECAGRDVAALADGMLYSCPFWWAAGGRYDAVQVRRGVGSMLEAAFAAFRETGDRKRLDAVLAAAGAVPSMSRRG